MATPTNSVTGASSKTARQSAGPAGGALAGRFPAPAMGTPSIVGWHFCDDFTMSPTATGWTKTDIAGGTTLGTETLGVTEIGIVRLTSGATSGDGGSISQAYGGMPSGVPVGTVFACKVWTGSTTQTHAAVGFIEDVATFPTVAANNEMVGFRALSTAFGANWFGITKNGAAAGNEVTVDMGVAADTTPRVMAFEYTSAGVSFYLLDCSSTVTGPVWVLKGSSTLHIPGSVSLGGNALYPCVMGATATAAARKVYCDFFNTGGAVAR